MTTASKIIKIWPTVVSFEGKLWVAKRWCEDNFGPDGESGGKIFPNRRWTYFFAPNSDRYNFYFKDKLDAVLFKLNVI